MTRLFALLLVGCWALAAVAQQPVDNYRVETQVANQSEAERVAAARATLGDVIVHITGDTAALQHPLVRQALNDAPSYLQKFSYNSDTQLVLNYSPQAVTQLLQQAQLIVASGAEASVITVVNVQDFASFKQLQAYLKTIGMIRRAQLLSVNKDAVQFKLTLDGDLEQLKSTLATGNKLQLVAGDTQTPLSFRWQH